MKRLNTTSLASLLIVYLAVGFAMAFIIDVSLYGPPLWPWENSFDGLLEGVSYLMIFASGALVVLSVPAWFAVAKLRRTNPAFTRRIVVVILLGYSLFPLGLIISFVSCFRTGCFGSLL